MELYIRFKRKNVYEVVYLDLLNYNNRQNIIDSYRVQYFREKFMGKRQKKMREDGVSLFSKINRGAILTFVVLIGVIIYLMGNYIYNNAQKEVIEEMAQEYLEIYVEYEMLPPEYRKSNPDITEQEMDEFFEQIRDELSVYYPEGEEYFEFEFRRKTQRLLAQAQSPGQRIIVSYDKRILEFEEFLFEGNTVDVKIRTLTSIEYLDPLDTAGGRDAQITDEMTDHIIFTKVEGEWKIIYSDISEPYSPRMDMPFR